LTAQYPNRRRHVSSAANFRVAVTMAGKRPGRISVNKNTGQLESLQPRGSDRQVPLLVDDRIQLSVYSFIGVPAFRALFTKSGNVAEILKGQILSSGHHVLYTQLIRVGGKNSQLTTTSPNNRIDIVQIKTNRGALLQHQFAVVSPGNGSLYLTRRVVRAAKMYLDCETGEAVIPGTRSPVMSLVRQSEFINLSLLPLVSTAPPLPPVPYEDLKENQARVLKFSPAMQYGQVILATGERRRVSHLSIASFDGRLPQFAPGEVIRFERIINTRPSRNGVLMGVSRVSAPIEDESQSLY
jgi:hypothetical protein